MSSAAPRTPIVDILRGWALLGVALVNFAIFYSFARVQRVPADDWPSQITKLFVQVVFQGKGWPALALLFGYGFSAWISNMQARGIHPVPGFVRRMLWLLIIGVVNCALYYGDVLKDYAVVGFVVLLFWRRTPRTVLAWGLGCLLLFPAAIAIARAAGAESPVASPDIALYRSHDWLQVLRFGLQSGLHIALSPGKYADWNLVMLGCALIGMYIQRVGWLENVAASLPLIRRIFLLSLAFTVATAGARAAAMAVGWNPDAYFDISFWPMLGQTAFFMAAICWLHARARLPGSFAALQGVGQMTLTNYFVQNLVSLLLFSGVGLGLLHRLPYWAHVGIAAALFIAQVYFSRYWLARYRIGPVEWMWRKLSRTVPVTRAAGKRSRWSRWQA